MSVFDWVVLLVLVISAGIGAWRGLIGEALSLVAWVLALLAAWLFGADVGKALFASWDPALRTAAGFALLIVLVLVVVAVIKLLIRGLLKALGLSTTDRILGVLFGLVRGLAIVLLLVMAGGMTSAPKQSWWIESKTSDPLETAVLMLRPWLPPELAKRIRY